MMFRIFLMRRKLVYILGWFGFAPRLCKIILLNDFVGDIGFPNDPQIPESCKIKAPKAGGRHLIFQVFTFTRVKKILHQLFATILPLSKKPAGQSSTTDQ